MGQTDTGGDEWDTASPNMTKCGTVDWQLWLMYYTQWRDNGSFMTTEQTSWGKETEHFPLLKKCPETCHHLLSCVLLNVNKPQQSFTTHCEMCVCVCVCLLSSQQGRQVVELWCSAAKTAESGHSLAAWMCIHIAFPDSVHLPTVEDSPRIRSKTPSVSLSTLCVIQQRSSHCCGKEKLLLAAPSSQISPLESTLSPYHGAVHCVHLR